MKKMSERQEKLDKIINEINDNYGIGNGFVDENTDVDLFIKEFKHKFMVKYDLSDMLSFINESNNKSYIERLNEI